MGFAHQQLLDECRWETPESERPHGAHTQTHTQQAHPCLYIPGNEMRWKSPGDLWRRHRNSDHAWERFFFFFFFYIQSAQICSIRVKPLEQQSHIWSARSAVRGPDGSLTSRLIAVPDPVLPDGASLVNSHWHRLRRAACRERLWIMQGGGIKPDFTWQRACTQVRRQSRLRLEEEASER